MEKSISKIGSTLNMVEKNMVKTSDLKDKLKEQFEITAKNLIDTIDHKNDPVVKRLQSRLLDLEKEKVLIKQKVEEQKSKVEKKVESVNGRGIQGKKKTRSWSFIT